MRRLGPFLLGAALAALLAWSLAPFAWQALTSLKSARETLASPVTYLPERPTLSNYAGIFSARPFTRYLLNSLIVAFATTLLCAFLGALAAYAFSRPRLPGSKRALSAVFALALFPPTLLVVPLYKLMQGAGLLNSPLGLVLPYTALNLPFCVWLLRAAFLQAPPEIEEAAQVDGLSPWQAFWRVSLPLAAPAVATAAILVFIFSWNEFLLALTFLSRDSARTVPVGIAMLSGASLYEVPWGQVSAAVVLTTLPVVLLVFLFQRRIVAGLTAGAVKG